MQTRSDKIATGVLYAVAGIIVLILASFYCFYILVRGFLILVGNFLTSPSKAYQEGGGIGIQLFNSLYLLLVTMIISFPDFIRCRDLFIRICEKNWFTDVVENID